MIPLMPEVIQAKLSAINPIWNHYKSYIGFPCKSYVENGKPGIRADFLYRICIGDFFTTFSAEEKNLRKKLIGEEKKLKFFLMKQFCLCTPCLPRAEYSLYSIFGVLMYM
jgi:hypothetical protein